MDTLTDANRFYGLSHAICYSYGTDNDDVNNIGTDSIIPVT